jgi:hypothetical protein
MSGRAFGRAQWDALRAISRSGPAGLSLNQALALRGKAKDFGGGYVEAAKNAINRHNAAVESGEHDARCDPDCPVGTEFIVAVVGTSRYRTEGWVRRAAEAAFLTAEDTFFLLSGEKVTTTDLWRVLHSPHCPVGRVIPLAAGFSWCELAGEVLFERHRWAALERIEEMVAAGLVTRVGAMRSVIDALPEVPEAAVAFLGAHRPQSLDELGKLWRQPKWVSADFEKCRAELARKLSGLSVDLGCALAELAVRRVRREADGSVLAREAREVALALARSGLLPKAEAARIALLLG